MLKDDVFGELRDGPKTVPEITNKLFPICTEWERRTKLKYVYHTLRQAEKWGEVEKDKLDHKTVMWRLV